MKKEDSIFKAAMTAVSTNRDFDWSKNPMTDAGAKRFIDAGMEDRLGSGIPLSVNSRAVQTADAFAGSAPYRDIPSVEDVSVLVQNGARLVLNLPFGTTTIPSPAGTSAQWAAEGVAVDDGEMTLSSVSVSPMACMSNIDVENRVLEMGGSANDNLILDILTRALWAKAESTILGSDAATAYSPQGAFYAIGKPSVTVNTDHLLSLEEEIAATKTPEGKYCYFTSQRGATILRRTPGTVGLGTRPLLDQGKVLDHPIAISNSVASAVGSDSLGEGLLFARISDLFIGMCGGYLIHLDPFTLSKQAITRITVQAWFLISGMRATSSDPYASTFARLAMIY
jgi:hypothetical protein